MQQAALVHRDTPSKTLHKGGEQETTYVEIPRKPGGSPPRVTVTLAGRVAMGKTTGASVTSAGKKHEAEPLGEDISSPLGQLPSTGGERSEDTESCTSSQADNDSDPRSTDHSPVCANDEAHYITTHEIQLCEADQEPDYPAFSLAPSTWGAPADSAPCPFLEYASFDSQRGSPTDVDSSYYLSTTSDPNPTDSTELVSTYSESDTSPSFCNRNTRDKEASSEGAQSKDTGIPSGQILLSIKTASKAINEPSNAGAKQNTAHVDAKNDTDMSYCVSRANESKQHQFYPQAAGLEGHRLVAIPARLHARSGVHAGISSGASSAVSELDDADKEVRNLTSRAFRSLAYPYFEAINFSSSESTTSLSDQNIGINSWSTYLDWKGSTLLSQKTEHSLLSHHKSAKAAATATFGLQKAIKDVPKDKVYLQANKSQTKAFELVVSEVATKDTSGGKPICTASRIKSGSRVVTLTETLNFSSNIKTTSAENLQASKASEHAPSSVCKDEVTEPLPTGMGAHEVSKATSTAAEAMEGAQKSKIASSLLKNVISKKMQLEQEFKMERGELTDTSQKARSNSAASKEAETSKEKGIQRQNSKFSEAGSDLTLVSSEDLGEFFDVKASTPKDFAPVEGSVNKQICHFESHREESVSDTKKSASEAMKGIFLRSQNSAFRSWKEREIEKMEKKIEEKVAKARKIKIPLERDWRAEFGEISNNTSTKMSRLFVPGIQHIPKEKQAVKQATKYSVSTYAHQSCFSRNENDIKIEKLHVLEATASRITPRITPKPQEIKLKLGLVSESKDSPFNIAKLLTPSLASGAASLSKAAEELRNQVPSRSEVLEKMPQFLVRDVRDPKPKAQGNIHQVRDVRKLLKSSYHQDPVDNSDKGSVLSDQSNTDPKSKLSVASKISSALSPIVITCQAVKNKEVGGQAEGMTAVDDNADTVLVHRASGRLPVATIAPNKTGPRMPVVKIVSKASKWKQEKPKEPEVKHTPEPKSPQSQGALEKLTAAVKTMEQLYVIDKKEWRRKSNPEPLMGSHVLSLINYEKTGNENKINTTTEEYRAKSGPVEAVEPRKVLQPPFTRAPEPLVRRNSYPNADKSQTKPTVTENKTPAKIFQVPRFGEQKSQEKAEKNTAIGNRSVFTVSAAPVKNKQQSVESSINNLNKRPQPPNSLNIRHQSAQEDKKADTITTPQGRKASADFENYLALPVRMTSEGTAAKPPVTGSARETAAISREPTTNIREPAAFCSLPPFSAKSQAPSPKSPLRAPTDWRSKLREGVQPNRASSAGSDLQSPDSVPPATIYHHPQPPMPVNLPSAPIFYSSPISSTTPTEIYPQQTQRKMLVDLATGQYYLVDTPVQPVKRRLFDPETGQYVEVPVPPPPVTPVPIHMPQLALSPGAYGAAYMFYPGFMSTGTPTMLPANTLQRQLSHSSSDHSFEMSGIESHPEVNIADGPYYLATGSSTTTSTPGQATNVPRGSITCPDGKQVISIMSQPGPRIVAPPSFDGNTMRFVVEHR
ncbi:uncharacterized protein C4orf54 homolog [Bombina bombina]|uniref:uncharacterized protein C4orf54 homolog n=1 Tax=Bombina bombina TaxID=8345 RepID=UPI00235AFC9C|nr:uncharacterized protein C4orf54 homolog [Bombina bombina]